MSQKQKETTSSNYNEDMNSLSKAEPHSDVKTIEEDQSERDSTHSPFSKVEPHADVIKFIEEDHSERGSTHSSFSKVEPHADVIVGKSIEEDQSERDSTLSEDVHDTAGAERDETHEAPVEAVGNEEVPKASEEKVTNEKPFPEMKPNTLKYKKQDTSFSSENHPVIAIFLWCVNNLIVNRTYTGTCSFLVTSGHFKTFAKLRLRSQPLFQSENRVPTRFNIHLYTPDIFTLLRKKFNVTEKCFQNSLGQEILVDFYEGCKSFLSPDELFQVAVVSENEKEQFQRILPEYFKYIVEKNGETCLPKYVSLLLVSWEKKKYNLLVSKNTILPTQAAARNFSVKGSVLRKNALQNRADLETGSIKLFFEVDDEKKKFHKIISQDIEFLRGCRAIHYQLFISEYKPEDLKTEHLEWLDTHPSNHNVPKESKTLEDKVIAEVNVSVDGEVLSKGIYNYIKKHSGNPDEPQKNTSTDRKSMELEDRDQIKGEEEQNCANSVSKTSTKSDEAPTSSLFQLPRFSKQSPKDTVRNSTLQTIAEDGREPNQVAHGTNEAENSETHNTEVNEVASMDVAQASDCNTRNSNTEPTPTSAIQFHKKKLKCNHEIQAVLGKSTTGSSGVLYCFEFRNILKSYTSRRKMERVWKMVTLGEYAMFASTVSPDDYAKRLLVVANRLFK